MQSKLSVLQVIPNLNVSGAEQGCIDIANHLSENNYNSYILTSSGLKILDVEKNGTKVLIGPVHSKNPLIIIRNIFLIANYINKYEIDIVHVRSRAPAWSTFFASKIKRIKFVTTFHGTYNFGGTFKKLYNSIMLKTDGTIAISKFIYEHIKNNYKIKNKNIQTIVRGIDLNFFNPQIISTNDINTANEKYSLQKDSIKILLPGRVTGWKGHLILIDAIYKLLEKHKLNLEVLFFGPDQNLGLKKKIERSINSKGLGDIVKFYGSSSQMNLIYALSDIVISASTDPEAFGRVSIESQAMGKYIIASDHGGSIETVIQDKTGCLYNSRDSSELAKKIYNVIEEKKYKSDWISKQAIEHIKNNYGKNKMCEDTIAFYKKIIHS